MKLGKNTILSKQTRIRYPDFFEMADHSVVDDFCYFSTKVRVGEGSHIANGCSVGGGPARSFELGRFSSVSAGVKIWCGSDDFVNDLVALVPAGCDEFKKNFISGDVIFCDFTAIGSGSVILPDNRVPEGTVIGALSLVPAGFKFEAWTVYAGNPLRKLEMRNRDQVLEQVEKLQAFYKRQPK